MTDDLDGCDIPFDDGAWNTSDADIDALVMFADVFGDPVEVAERRRELIEWSAG